MVMIWEYRRFVRSTCVALFLLQAAVWGATNSLQFVRVSPRDPRYFETEDGQPFLPIGLNMVHPGGRAGEETATMQRWIESLSAAGGNFIRIWLSSQWWNPESRPGEFDERRADRLKWLLDLCGRHKVRVKITLDHFRELVPPDAGGSRTWALRTAYHVSQGGPLKSMDEFWGSEAGRTLFLRRLDWLAERFRDRPEIFGWELWNEINAARGSPELQYQWTCEMLAELRRRFPRHLAMQSLGSFDRVSLRPLYERYVRLELNQVAQVHRYLDLGAQWDVCHGPMDRLAATAVMESRAWAPAKPILLAESGAVEPRHTGPFALYPKDRMGVLLHDVLFAPFFAGAAGSGQCWHWDSYVDANQLWWHFGRFRTAVEGVDPPAERFQALLITSHPPIRVYGLVGRHIALLWCRDARAHWRAELEEGQLPPTVADWSLPLADLQLPFSPATIAAYDPWHDRTVALESKGPAVCPPPFQRSIVIRLCSTARSHAQTPRRRPGPNPGPG